MKEKDRESYVRGIEVNLSMLSNLLNQAKYLTKWKKYCIIFIYKDIKGENIMEINYKALGLTVDKSWSTFDFNGIEIEISNYLPAQDKYDLIMTTIQKSFEET